MNNNCSICNLLIYKKKGLEDTIFSRQINRVISHPTLPLTITAHEDRHIRFYDNNSGKLAHAMVAHLDAVTCLAVDPNGLYLLSGSTPWPPALLHLLRVAQDLFTLLTLTLLQTQDILRL